MDSFRASECVGSSTESVDGELIFVIDDDPVVLSSLKAVLVANGYVPRCHTSAQDFLADACHHAMGCVITDLQMPGMSGMELQSRLIDSGSALAVIVVSGVADVASAVRMMESGCVTLLEKPYDPAALLGAVKKGLARSRQVCRERDDARCVAGRMAQLTDEEHQVMDCILRGLPNKAIGSLLGLSLRTIDRRRQSVLEKMQVRSLPELATLVARHRDAAGLTAPSLN